MFCYTLFWWWWWWWWWWCWWWCWWWWWWCWYDVNDNIRPRFKGAGFVAPAQHEDDAFAGVRWQWRFTTEEFLAWAYLNPNGMWQWNTSSVTYHFFLEVWACGMWYLWLCMTMGGWESAQIGFYVSSETGGQPRTKIQQASFCAPFRVVWKESKLQASFIFFWQDPRPQPKQHVYPTHPSFKVWRGLKYAKVIGV